MAKANLTLDVRGIPETVHALRREMAAAILDAAEHEENAAVSERLREIAYQFDAGIKARFPEENSDG